MAQWTAAGAAVRQNDRMSLDIAAVRAAFPALGLGVAHFDGPGGSQTPQVVADAVARAMTAGVANRGTVTEAERRAEEIVVGARAAVADLLGCEPGGVVFGRSMTQLTYDVARALAKQWGPGDEVVVTRLDHDGNIRPWVDAAAAAGATVRWAEFDKETAELPVETITDLLNDAPAWSRSRGRRTCSARGPTSPAIAAAAHKVGALVYVDGVHLTPHAPST